MLAGILLAAALPLSVGMKWTYAGTVRGNYSRMTPPRKVRTVMRVAEHERVGRFDVYVLRDAPWDLSCFVPKSELPPMTNVIVRDGAKYYHLQLNDPDPFAEAMTDEAGIEKQLEYYAPFIEMPMEGRTSTGCQQGSTKDCWTIEEKNGEFAITFRSSPDDQTIHFRPGVGITGYGYVNRSSPCRIDVRLVR